MTTNSETPQSEMEQVNLTDSDKLLVTDSVFAIFKKQLPLDKISLKEAIKTMLVLRQFLEANMFVRYHKVKDCHKKHAWLSQKINDLLKTNSALIHQREIH